MRRTKRGGWPYSQPPNVQFEINRDSPQSDGLVLWMPWGGGAPGAHRHVDRVAGLAFTEGGTPTWVADGKRGWSMLFDDAASEYLTVGSGVLTAEPITMACWFRSDDITKDQALVTLDRAANSGRWVLRVAGTTGGDPVGAYKQNDAFGTSSAISTAGFVANTWHHACGVFVSDTERHAFIDGGNKGTSVVNIVDPTAPTQTEIGAILRAAAPLWYMSGYIADVRIYNRALTDTEVKQVYTEPWELYKPLIRRFLGWSPPAPTTTTTTLAPTTTSTTTLAPTTTSTSTLAPTTTSTSTLAPTTSSTTTLAPTTSSTSTLPPTTTSTSTLPPTTTSTSTLPPTTTSTSTLPPTTTSTSTLPPTTTSTTTLAPTTTSTTTLAPTTTSTTTLAPTTTSTTTLAPTTTSTSTLPPTTTSTTTLAPTTTSTSTLPPTTTSTSTLPPTTTSTTTLAPTTSTTTTLLETTTTSSTTTLAPTTTSTSTLLPTTSSTTTLAPTTSSTTTLAPTTSSTTTLAPTTSSTTTLAPTTSSTTTLAPTTTSTSTLAPTSSTTTLAPTTTTSTSTVAPETTTSTSTLSTTVTTTTLPPAPAAPTTPTHEESLSLTINVFTPDFSTGVYKPRGMYITSLQQEVNSYSHTIKAFGGYWSAKFAILDKQEDMEGWLTDGLGRHIEVYDNALVKIWEGFVNQVDLTLGGLTATRGPLLDVANRVSVVYSGTSTETDPPVAGNRVRTAPVNDLESQGQYGIIEQILSAGGMMLIDAEQARDTYMAENSEPKTIQKLGSGGGLNVSISCLGYVHWFNYLISLVGVEGTVNLNTKLGQVLDADSNGLFASSNSDLMPNTLQVPAYDNKSRTAWDVAKELVALGDETDTRYIFGVYADRHVTYQPTNQDEIAYRYFPGDPARRIESSTGGNVWPWNVLPGRWMFFPSFLIGRTFPDDWRQDPRFMFIESVVFRLPHTLQLQGGRLDTIPQKLAKMGLAGIGA